MGSIDYLTQKLAEAGAKIKRQRQALREMNRALLIKQHVMEQGTIARRRTIDGLYRDLYALKAENEQLRPPRDPVLLRWLRRR